MTAQDYVQYIAQDFRNGKLYTEIPTNDPRNLSYRIRRGAQKLGWHFQIMDTSLIVTPKKAKTTRTPEPRMIEAEPIQEELFPKIELLTRPVCGPRCSVPGCEKVLYHYEIKLGKCLPHRKATS